MFKFLQHCLNICATLSLTFFLRKRGFMNSNRTKSRDARINIMTTREHRIMLEKLSKIHERSMTGVFEMLVKQESKVYGLIESRE